MRNLKKFLALALAMVMAFSMVLSANALEKYDQVKAWDDKDQVTKEFVEAVDVLSGMKVFQGDDRGFAPGATITRAETAALIYRIATGDVDNVRNGLYANYGNFKDVNEGDWFAGYVGYCANAGYIKGHDGYFNPYAPVTGYEALAMILRAVGYDKNHEFEGATWQTNVSALGTRLGVLDDVKTSDYGNTLHLASRRDVVASILFECVQVDTVTYTPALGYETQKFSVNTADGWDGKSLGEIYFGLTEIIDGIIVGNQDTGESKTIINKVKSTYDGYFAYFYDVKQTAKGADKNTQTEVNTQYKIDAKTGIDMFGHKVHVWYNADTSKTYALYDQAVKTAVVTVDKADTDAKLSDSAWAAVGDAKLGEAAQKAGFSVDLKSSKAVYNQSFGKSAATYSDAKGYNTDYQPKGSTANNDGEGKTAAISATMNGKTGTTDAYPLYLLISNNSDLTVDMVVALNVEVSRVSQVNNHAKYPTVTVPTLAKEWNAKQTNSATVAELLPQTALTATSTKGLGDAVVGVSIVGTKAYKPGAETVINVDANYADPWRRLSKPTQTVEGTVTNFNYDATSHTGSIVIGGQTIQRSLLADAIVAYDPAVNPVPDNRGMLNTKPVNLSATAQLYGNYRAYLDAEGKYIWIEPIYDSKFVYATYIDYTTPYGSSSYEYTLIGVDLNGEQVKQVVKTIDGNPINASNYRTIAPARDTASGVAGVNPYRYIGYLISGDGNLTTISALTGATVNDAGLFDTISPVVKQAGKGTSAGTAGGGILDNEHPVTITSTDARLGSKNLDVTSGTAANADTTYFTNDTKFIVVDGAGTDTQKIEVYNGMTELLKGGRSVTIRGENNMVVDGAYLSTLVTTLGTTTSVTDGGKAINGSKQGVQFEEQMYYTSSALTYASVQDNPQKVDTIVLPKKALTWSGSSDLYYVGNPAQNSEIKSGNDTFHLYTMYLDGEPQQVWLLNDPNSTTAGTDAANPGSYKLLADSFYRLYATSKKTPMGDTVYVANNGTNTAWTTALAVAQPTLDANKRPELHTMTTAQGPILGNGVVSRVYYNAATYSSQTAIIGAGDASGTAAGMTVGTDCALFNVANAKVVNLNAANSPIGSAYSPSTKSQGYVWPGISDLVTLNDAASTADTYHNTLQPKVCVQLDPTDNLTVTVIYVCWNQDIA